MNKAPDIIIGGTSARIRNVKQRQAPRYLFLTEGSMGDNIAAAKPGKEMLCLCTVRCPHMNEITLEDTLDALQLNRYVIEVPAETRVSAARAVEQMIAGPDEKGSWRAASWPLSPDP